MTIRERLTGQLVDNGLSKAEAGAVIEAIEEDETMAGRWDDEAEGYPRAFLALVWSVTRYHALSWIDAHKPKHWARPMFENKDRTDPVPQPSSMGATTLSEDSQGGDDAV